MIPLILFNVQKKNMKAVYVSILIISVSITSLYGQDLYHQELLAQLENEYAIQNPSFIFSSNELDNINDFTIYGNATMVSQDIENFTFSKKTTITVNSTGNNPWDSGWGISNNQTINQDDIVLLAFWARRVSPETDLRIFIEDNDNFEKEVYTEISFTQDWSQYFIAFKASKTYTIGKIKFGFHLASAVQNFEIAGFTALNYKTAYELNDVPSIYNPANYGGNEEDAPWRAEAAARIDTLRKRNLIVKVVDNQGNLIENAEVQVNMTKHDFGFGSALVTCRFEGNDCYNPVYVEKISNLDGNGHGFNVAVTENALKWDAWEEEWLGTPQETKAAISYLDDLGIEVRGHTLIWPGWNTLPNDMQQNATNEAYLKNRVMERIELMLTDDILGDVISDWDVVNEITTNRDLENAFKGEPGYTTGREVYLDIFDKVTELKPNNTNYINDYVTLSNGGFGQATTDLYKQFVTEIIDAGSKIDGIGFQSHIGPFPTSIYKVEEILNEFDALFDVEMKVTEYDIDDNVDPEIQAKYLTDFLTMIFSHPKMEAFLMWGFYDGNHWKGNAPMYDINWNLKPSGQAFIDLVFDDWWTNESGSTAINGQFETPVFKGEHEITVTYNNETFIVQKNIVDHELVEITVGPTSVNPTEIKDLIISPNPNTGTFSIINEELPFNTTYNILDLNGKIVRSNVFVKNGKIELDLMPGFYLISATIQDQTFISKLIID